MHRRTLLAVTGAAFATGTGIAPAAASQGDDEQETEEEGTPPPAPDLEFGDRTLLIDDTGYSPEAWAVVAVRNSGGVASGESSVTAEWLDADGNLLDTDDEYLPTLGAGETWHAHIRAFGPDPAAIDEFEVTGEFDASQPLAPRGMTIADSDLQVDDSRSTITGVAENTREADLEAISARGKFYDADGIVLAGGRAWEGDRIPPGRDWSFEIGMQSMPYQAAEPTDHAVLLDTRTHEIRG